MEAEDHPREARMAASPRTSCGGAPWLGRQLHHERMEEGHVHSGCSTRRGECWQGGGLPVHGWSVAATPKECHWHSNAAEELVNMRVSEMPCFRAVTCGSRHFLAQSCFGAVMSQSSQCLGTVMFWSGHGSDQACDMPA